MKLDKIFLNLYIQAAGMLPDRSPVLIGLIYILFEPLWFVSSTLGFPRFQRAAMKHDGGKSNLEISFTCGKHREEEGG